MQDVIFIQPLGIAALAVVVIPLLTRLAALAASETEDGTNRLLAGIVYIEQREPFVAFGGRWSSLEVVVPYKVCAIFCQLGAQEQDTRSSQGFVLPEMTEVLMLSVA